MASGKFKLFISKPWLTKALTITGIGVVGFAAGIAYENQRIISNLNSSTDPYVIHSNGNIQQFVGTPGLPIFGTVSAATAFTPTEVDKTQAPARTSRTSQIMKYGFPGLDHVRSYSDYVLSYDRRTRVAHWVFEHLTAERVKRNEAVDRTKCNFHPDESIHTYFRSLNSDYKGSGFDRGHLAAAGNHKFNQKFLEETFLLTNMAPQVGEGFNRSVWNRLESYVRKLARKYPNVYVCTGPLYLPKKEDDGKTYVRYQVIGANNVAVPTHFYKIVVCETTDGYLEMESYVLPNAVVAEDTPLNVYLVPPTSIERSSGLLFFDQINQKQLRKINGKKV